MFSDKPSINPGSLIGGCVNAENLRSDASFSAEKKEKWVTRAGKGTKGRTGPSQRRKDPLALYLC